MPFASTRIDDKQAIRAYLASKRPKAFLLGLAPICVLFVFAPYLIKTVYGGVYDNSIGILRILLIGCVPALYSGFYSPLLYALERYRFAQCADAAQAVANILLDLALVWRIGVYGAAVATLIACCGRTVMLEVYFRKQVAPLFDA
jgi:O-antigen/teichoic acid export membrane protein